MGHPKAEGQTPREHQVDVEEELPPQPVDRIVAGFHTAHYGNRTAGSDEMQGLLRDLSTLRQREATWQEEEKAREREADSDPSA